MITTADSHVLDQYFDRRTLARARTYVAQGAVLEVDWSPEGESVSATVLGSRAIPYEVTVDLVRGRNGLLVSIDGECSCPVAFDCKHSAAVLLSHLSAERAPAGVLEGASGLKRPERRPTPAVTAWDSLLGGVLEDERSKLSVPEGSLADVALQFELVTTTSPQQRPVRATRVPRDEVKDTERIHVRPVVRSSSGNWVRTGITWRSFDYPVFTGSGRRVSPVQVPLLKELRALSSLANSSYYSSYSSEDVWLDSIVSRRLWDLLGEAQDVGITLIGAGRSAAPVTVHRMDAELVLDATSALDAPGITLRPRLALGAAELSLDEHRSLLIGTPPHGIAWWDSLEDRSSAETPPLSLARLSEGLTGSRQALLTGDALVVPHEHEERFFAEMYPRLRRRIRVQSTDGSVTFPELPDEALILSLRHVEDHRIELAWATGGPGTTWREELRDAAGQPFEGAIGSALAAAQLLTLRSAVSRELVHIGDRLAPEASLQGMSAVRFLSDLLPELEAIPGLVVEHSGDVPEYKEATEGPVVTLTGTGGGGSDWFDLAVDVRVGGEVVPFLDLFVALASEQTHMVLPSGTYFSLESGALRELAQLIGEARALHDVDGDHIRVNRYQASLWEDFERLGVLTSQAAEWERSVRALATASDRIEHSPPAGVEACLRPYQQVGFNWLAYLYELGLGGILADDMGLGKTLQVLALVCHVREQRLNDAPFLVVAPTSVVGNWAAECRKFAPELRVDTVQATEGRRGTALSDLAAGADVLVTSYALFRMEYDDYEEVEWAGLVLDEAQFAKNMHSHAYQREDVARPVQAGSHRHADGEPPDGAVGAALDHGTGPLRQRRAVQRVLPPADRAPWRRGSPHIAAAPYAAAPASALEGAGCERPPEETRAGDGARARPEPPEALPDLSAA